MNRNFASSFGQSTSSITGRRIPYANARLNAQLDDDDSFYEHDGPLVFPYENNVDNNGRITTAAHYFVRYPNQLCHPEDEDAPDGFEIIAIDNDTHPERVRHIVVNQNFVGNNFLTCRTVNRIVSSDNIFNLLSSGYHPLNGSRRVVFNYINNVIEETSDATMHDILQYMNHQKQLSKAAYKNGRFKPRSDSMIPSRYTKSDHVEFVGMISEAALALGFRPRDNNELIQLKADMAALCPTYEDFVENPEHPLENRVSKYDIIRNDYYSFDVYCPDIETAIEIKDCRDFHRKMHQGPGKYIIKTYSRQYRQNTWTCKIRKTAFLSTNMSPATRVIFINVPCIIAHAAAVRGTSIESIIFNPDNEYLTLNERLTAMKAEFDANVGPNADRSIDIEYTTIVKLLRQYNGRNGIPMQYHNNEVSDHIVNNIGQVVGVYGTTIDRISPNFRRILEKTVRLKHYTTLDDKRMYKDGVRCLIYVDESRDKPILQLRTRVQIIRTSLRGMDTHLMKFIGNSKWLSLLSTIENMVHHFFDDLMRGNINDRVDYNDVVNAIDNFIVPGLLAIVNREGGRNVDEVIAQLEAQHAAQHAVGNQGNRNVGNQGNRNVGNQGNRNVNNAGNRRRQLPAINIGGRRHH